MSAEMPIRPAHIEETIQPLQSFTRTIVAKRGPFNVS